MFGDGFNKGNNRLETTTFCGCHPFREEATSSADIGVFPKSLELIFEDPCTPDATITLFESIEITTLSIGSCRRMPIEQPAQPFNGFCLGASFKSAPFFHADIIKGFVESFNNMKSVKNQFGLGTPLFNGCDIGCAHIARSEANVHALKVAETIFEEKINCLASFALTDPDDTASVQVVDDRCIAFTIVVGNLINADGSQRSDAMIVPKTLNGTMKNVGEGRFADSKQLSSLQLGHGLAIMQGENFEAIGYLSINSGPGNGFLPSCVSWATDLLGSIVEIDIHTANPDIVPHSLFGHGSHYLSSAITLRTATTIAVGLNPEVELFAPFLESESFNPKNFA